MSELEFKQDLKKELIANGAMISHFEPNIGSTPGVPDSLVSWDNGELWLEIKISERIPTTGLVWDKLLRASQKRWVKDRYSGFELEGEQLVPYYVAVRCQFGVWLYTWSIFTKELKPVRTNMTMGSLLLFFKEICQA